MKYLKYLNKKSSSVFRKIKYEIFISNSRKKKFCDDIKKFKSKLKKNENFAFSRFSDGELFVLQNRKLIISRNYWLLDKKKIKASFSSNEVKKFIPTKHQSQRKLLFQSLKFNKINYFKGISCTCCNGYEYVKYFKNIIGDDKNITFSNVFQNGNYSFFIQKILKILKKKK